MKISMLAYMAVFTVLLLGSAAPSRSDLSPATTFVGTHYEGQVQNLDSAAGTGAILTRFGQRILPFKITADTKIWQTQPMAARNLQPGAKVMVIGKENNKAGDELTPYIVNVLPDLPPASSQPAMAAKGQARILFGTLSMNGDDYSLVDRAGRTYTLIAKGNKMLVGQTIPASIDDVDEGSPIKLDGQVDGGTFTVSKLVIAPGFKRGGAGKKAKAKGNPADLAAVGERALSMTPDGTPGAPVAPKPSSKFNDGDFGIYDLF